MTLVLNLAPDFRHNEFLLEFEQHLPITVVSPTSRTLNRFDAVDRGSVSGQRLEHKTLISRYRMASQVTVQL